ncbi:MAG: hypothetical protein LBR44_10050 [Clostridiales Family XIII bacterium]|nr:hypothetical protein [Clostridiales Family XIII bacterium]
MDIEEIAAMDGVDGVFIGPYDLSIAIGKPAQFESPEFAGAVGRIIQACKSSGKPCFAYAANIAAGVDYLNKGCSGVAINLDTAVYIEAFRRYVAETIALLK